MHRRTPTVLTCALLAATLAAPVVCFAQVGRFDGAWTGTLLSGGERYATQITLRTAGADKVAGTMELVRIGGGERVSYELSGKFVERTLTYRATRLGQSAQSGWCLPDGYLRHETDKRGVVSLVGRVQTGSGGGCSRSLTGAIRFNRPGKH
jgi:hypothetical protein